MYHIRLVFADGREMRFKVKGSVPLNWLHSYFAVGTFHDIGAVKDDYITISVFEIELKPLKDLDGNIVKLPETGDKVIRDGYLFRVINVTPNDDVCIVASISLRGRGGTVEVGYYDYLKHEKI